MTAEFGPRADYQPGRGIAIIHPDLRSSRETIMKIDGRCHCGYVTFEAEADSETTTICNCTDCQTMSGAPLRAVIITHPGTFVLLSGKPTEYRKTAESGNVRLQAFCPHCGTAIYATSTGDEPKAYNVRLGALRQRNELCHAGRYLLARNSNGSTTSTRSRNSRGRRTDVSCWHASEEPISVGKVRSLGMT